MNKKALMGWLVWAIIFLIIALIAGLFGFGLLSGFTFKVARVLAIVFVILSVIAIVAHTIKKA